MPESSALLAAVLSLCIFTSSCKTVSHLYLVQRGAKARKHVQKIEPFAIAFRRKTIAALDSLRQENPELSSAQALTGRYSGLFVTGLHCCKAARRLRLLPPRLHCVTASTGGSTGRAVEGERRRDASFQSVHWEVVD